MQTDFITSAVSADGFPMHRFPEIALAGRSNVGKSSLINCIAGRNGLARVSKNPGCTKTLNFYNFCSRISVVDLPGYGYAAVSRSERGKWAQVVDEYLEERDNLAGLAVVVDGSVPPSELDLQMIKFAVSLSLNIMVVATKLDKVNRSGRQGVLNGFKKIISADDIDLVGFSSKTGEGKNDLLSWMAVTCGVKALK